MKTRTIEVLINKGILKDHDGSIGSYNIIARTLPRTDYITAKLIIDVPSREVTISEEKLRKYFGETWSCNMDGGRDNFIKKVFKE